MSVSTYKVILILFTLLLATGWAKYINANAQSLQTDGKEWGDAIALDMKDPSKSQGGINEGTSSTEASYGDAQKMGKNIFSILGYGLYGMYVPSGGQNDVERTIDYALWFTNVSLSLICVILIYMILKNKKVD